jgi:S1-C subfamily serine protease
VRGYLGLGADEGLMVESVQADTLAAALELQPNDIVVRIGGETIGSPEDVQQALSAIDAGQQVEVEFVRAGKHLTKKAEKPGGGTAGSPLRERKRVGERIR